ncbi:hypothetical protein BU25DRAFT_417340 [Macroventuria anomochaeta]|uniref:Uncharacterized protein n=1 Tax=Macroventuria anomochaeta TaxID=301207 RepID=A0ACB6SFI8_9PLEO|nr:uncharacterized protein BU25DRAFT_417340 [Macroventuria anomochaeta]KAF2632748.1 hypothetical protein BU25DRAFT_417340 [Macroventuria anomochaeta]
MKVPFHQALLAICTFTLTAATPLLRLYHFEKPRQTTSIPPRHETIQVRDDLEEHGKIGGMYMCTGINFTGTCKYIQPAMGTCYTLPAPFKSSIASFGPDQAFSGSIPAFAFGCRLYEDETCSAGKVRFEYPRVSSGKLWVDPKSVQCKFYNQAAMNLYKWLLES